MAKKEGVAKALNFIAWFTGVVVSLAVGTALTDNTLDLPKWLGGASAVGDAIGLVVGWIVIITTLISVVLAIIHKK